MPPPEPTSLRTKLFGDNRLNFYGWIVAGILVMGTSLWALIMALRAGLTRSPTGWALMAIYFVLFGQFGIALQNYCARVARSLDDARRRPDDKPEA